MANLDSSKKNIRKIEKLNLSNRRVISKIKTINKKTRASKSQDNLSVLYQTIDSALAKGKITQNKANRLKSRAAKAIAKPAAKPAAKPSADVASKK